MHIAKLFDHKRPDEIVVARRKWPLVTKEEGVESFDINFLTIAFFVRFNITTGRFEFSYEKEPSSKDFEEIPDKYCQDHAWVFCSIEYSLFLEKIDKKMALCRKKVGIPCLQYDLKLREGFLEANLLNPLIEKFKGLRV